MGWTTAVLDDMAAVVAAAGSLEVDLVRLHTGDPGAAGTDNVCAGTGYADQACSLAVAPTGDGEVETTAEVDFGTGNPDWGTISHFSFWSTATFRGGFTLTESKTISSDPVSFPVGALVASVANA